MISITTEGLILSFARRAGVRSALASFIFVVATTFLATLLLFAISGQADAQKSATEKRDDDTICVELTQLAERTRRFPKGLLYAIARIESGRKASSSSAVTPWPWTVTVKGKGNYYASKQEAVKAIKQFQRDGHSNIDVGCMQVNLYHHGRAFRSVEEAIDPVNNVAYATEYLVVLYKRYRNWQEAIKYYHSSDPTKHDYYLARVRRTWDASKAPRSSRRSIRQAGRVNQKKPEEKNSPILSNDEGLRLEREALLLSDNLRKKLGIDAPTTQTRNNNRAQGRAGIASSAQNSNADFFLDLIDEPR